MKTFKQFKEEQMQDPEFVKAFEEAKLELDTIYTEVEDDEYLIHVQEDHNK